jgi:uncharacterized protein YndB with AHSA1/START domain
MKGGAAVAQTETETLVREVQVDATPETIFPFLTDPVQMTRWMGREATLDPRPGGIYRVDVTGTHVARGEFVEVSAPTPFRPARRPSRSISWPKVTRRSFA